jgi:NADPH2:quinone reductase
VPSTPAAQSGGSWRNADFDDRNWRTGKAPVGYGEDELKKRGGTVVATTSTTAKGELAQRAGADHVTAYDEFVEATRRISGERGADVVYDNVGKDTFDDSLKALRPRGMMVLYGGSSGQVPPFDPQRLNSGGSLFVTRPTIAHYTAEREELLWRAREVLGAVADGTLRVEIGGRYGLDEAAQAYRDLEGRRTTGKLLIVP